MPCRTPTVSPRVALLAEVEIADTEFTIVTTHLQNEEHEAGRQLAWLLTRLQSVDGPCLLLGDLNLRPRDIEEMIPAAGFVHVAVARPNRPTRPCSRSITSWCATSRSTRCGWASPR